MKKKHRSLWGKFVVSKVDRIKKTIRKLQIKIGERFPTIGPYLL